MTTTVSTPTQVLPTGRWQLDPTHSSASFAVKHMGVATFRGRFEEFDARLEVAAPSESGPSVPLPRSAGASGERCENELSARVAAWPVSGGLPARPARR